jgi:ribonuclease HI
MSVVIYTDGGARGNPGPAGAGAIILKDGVVIVEIQKYLGPRQTNNWAEYEALCLALEEARRRELEDVEIRMDSELIVKQMRGEYRVKEPSLKQQYEKARALLRGFASARFVHVRREENKEADRLVNEAIDSA